MTIYIGEFNLLEVVLISLLSFFNTCNCATTWFQNFLNESIHNPFNNTTINSPTTHQTCKLSWHYTPARHSSCKDLPELYPIVTHGSRIASNGIEYDIYKSWFLYVSYIETNRGR
jgi:hypothetical protein